MKTSTVVLIGGGVAVAGVAYYLYKRSQSKQLQAQPAVVIESKPIMATQGVIDKKPQAPVFIPIIKNPEDPKPEKITTVTAQPVAKPVYVAPVNNPAPVSIAANVTYKKTVPVQSDDTPAKQGVALSGFKLF